MLNLEKEYLDELASVLTLVDDGGYTDDYVNTVKRLKRIYINILPFKHASSTSFTSYIIDLQRTGKKVPIQHKIVLRDLFIVLTTPAIIDFRNHVMFAGELSKAATAVLDIQGTDKAIVKDGASELGILFEKYGVLGVAYLLQAVVKTAHSDEN